MKHHSSYRRLDNTVQRLELVALAQYKSMPAATGNFLRGKIPGSRKIRPPAFTMVVAARGFLL